MSAVLASTARRPPLALLGIAAVLLLPFIAYFSTVRSIVTIWEHSGTFAHGFVILPISLWLIWQRRDMLARIPVAPYWPALPMIAAVGFGWMLAEFGEVQVLRQYAFALILPLTVLAMLGKQMARAMAFPLLFILFGVPFGEVFTDPLINVTANFTVDALRMTGIPVFREGNNFTIPSGSWSVVEACSGVRYLIASVTLGCLYAYLTYRSAKRRAMFMVMAVIVPIIANGLRAYMIVMMGHLSGMTMAVGFDHLIYGWVFFGLVMFLLFWIGSFWREDNEPVAAANDPAPVHHPLPVKRLAQAGLAAALCIAIWPAYVAYLERSAPAPARPELAALQGGWPAATPFTTWMPNYSTPSAQLQQFFAHGAHPVGLTLLYYRDQHSGAKLISSTNRLANADISEWRQASVAARVENLAGRQLAVREATLNGPAGRMLVWTWYWIDGSATTNDYVGKALQVRQKLLHGSDDGAAIIVFAAMGEQPDTARAALREFLGANLAAIDATLARNRRH